MTFRRVSDNLLNVSLKQSAKTEGFRGVKTRPGNGARLFLSSFSSKILEKGDTMDNLHTISLIYLLVLNLMGFFSMGADKAKAESNSWRTPEKTLFLIAILGGSIGSILGMKIFRHKTRHAHFVIGMPLILGIQLAAILILHFI